MVSNIFELLADLKRSLLDPRSPKARGQNILLLGLSKT
jgi:hypothetical protein